MVTLERAIVGALMDTINAHGPITRQWIGSAAKRVAGNLPALRAAPPSEREVRLEEALKKIMDGGAAVGDTCGCEHDNENCCVRAGYYCHTCIAAVALRDAPDAE